MDFVSKLEPTLRRFTFSHWGITPLARPLSLGLYRNWLEAGHHGAMDYLARHLPLKEEPERFQPRARSAIVVAKSYFPHPYPSSRSLQPRTALYASGKDYHHEFKAELESVAEGLRFDWPNEEFLCFTDSAPILERDLAARAGLGWVGKNTCLIHPRQGSLFFIGEILTSMALNGPEKMVPDFCGTCDRCLKACPTGALEAPRVLNARKCISYWTIEAKTVAPESLRSQFGSWFFGCDICQTVCPWNEKHWGAGKMRALSQNDGVDQKQLYDDLRWILESSSQILNRELAELPYSRARARGLKRNALYVVANLGLKELEIQVDALCSDSELGELARWTKVRLHDANI